MARPKKTPKIAADAAIEAIQQAKGNLTAAADALGVGRSTLYRYVNEHSTVKDALDEARESLIDVAENKLADQINEGNMTAIIFFLKTQGKGRGYVERSEFTGADGGPLPIAIINADPDDV